MQRSNEKENSNQNGIGKYWSRDLPKVNSHVWNNAHHPLNNLKEETNWSNAPGRYSRPDRPRPMKAEVQQSDIAREARAEFMKKK